MTSHRRISVLVSGAGVAGLTAAHWLARHGCRVTVVERAPAPRPGGQAIDVRGPALDVAARMGVLDDVRRLGTGMRGMTMLDFDGNELFRSTEHTVTGGAVGGPEVEIFRDDLSRLLAAAVPPEVDYLFDDSVAEIAQDDDGVRVAFERARPARFDLVVGADGLHSAVRRLAFACGGQAPHHLGSYVAFYTAPNFLDLDHWQVFLQGDGDAGGGVMSAGDRSECRVMLGFGSDPLDIGPRDTAAQKREVARRLAHLRGPVPRALEFMWQAPDFHFDPMAQIRLPRWSNGRVVLLGDAGYCGSPMSGQGTTLAMAGAYVLAGELGAAGGDHRAGFAGYEHALRDFADSCQRLALANMARVRSRTDSGAGPDTAVAADLAESTSAVVDALILKDY